MSELQKKLIISLTGSRMHSGKAEDLPEGLRKLLKTRGSLLVHGGAGGFDKAIEQFAIQEGIPQKIIRPDYLGPFPKYHDKFGWIQSARSAPLARNHDIIDAGDILIGAHAPGSRGTTYTLNEALKAGKAVYKYDITHEAPQLVKLLTKIPY